ncbi:hypothetical protein FPOAC2_13768 [Fusarium poae]
MPIRGVSFGTDQPPDAIRQLIRRWLTDEEADNIFSRFQEACIPNRQVLWSGMLPASSNLAVYIINDFG